MKPLLATLKRLYPTKRNVRRLYETRDYLDAYTIHRDEKVENKRPSGAYWEQMGRHQFDFLVEQGLEPHYSMLDIGCGQLRGGRFFIEYLEPGRYTGIDISPKSIEFCRTYVEELGLASKRPRLLVNEEKHLRFTELAGTRFDFLLAQSVFSHLPGDLIEECFANLHKVMHGDSRFYFTYVNSAAPEQINVKSFSFPYTFFAELADRHGFALENLSAQYRHPGGQDMLCARPKRAA